MKQASEGDVVAAMRLFDLDEFATDDVESAMKRLRVAAERGAVLAEYDLGIMLVDQMHGGRFGDRDEGRRWLEKAATQGDRGARAALEGRCPPSEAPGGDRRGRSRVSALGEPGLDELAHQRGR